MRYNKKKLGSILDSIESCIYGSQLQISPNYTSAIYELKLFCTLL